MAKKDDYTMSASKLPEEVRSLIVRKLRYLRIEQKGRWVDVSSATSSKLSEQISANIKVRMSALAINALAVSGYREIVANAMAVTNEWLEIVWGTIVSILEKAQVAVVNGQELNDIIDEYAWSRGQHPFTLAYIDSQRFHDGVQRTIGRYGLKTQSSLCNSLLLEAAAGASGIMTRGWHERERISIAIAEYILVNRQSASSAVPSHLTPSYIKREALKLKTKDLHVSWQNAYRELTRSNPDKTGEWYAKKIEKMDIAHGRNFRTIRKNMKK